MIDKKLDVIVKYITQTLDVKSIILTGSRAKGTDNLYSDYDIVVLVSVFQLPIYYLRLKQISKNLSDKLSIEVDINPLLDILLNGETGNLFLYKLKEDGIVLAGKNVLDSIRSSHLTDLRFEWYFSYICSLMKKLLEMNIDGNLINNNFSSFKNSILNSIIEFEIMIFGKTRNKIMYKIKYIRKYNLLLNDWLLIRDLLIYLLIDYSKLLFNNKNSSLYEYSKEWLKTDSKIAFFKNIEFFILYLINNKKLPKFGSYFLKIPIKNIVRVSLIMLLMSVEENCINSLYLNISKNYLYSCFYIDESSNEMELWMNIKNVIINNWGISNTVLGI